MTRWIDADDLTVSDRGFLVESQNLRNGGRPHYGLHARPGQTNLSHEPQLYGWLGTTNDVYRCAHGIARVVRTTAHGRAQVTSVSALEADAYLSQEGWPELLPEVTR